MSQIEQKKWLLIDDIRTIPGVDKIARTYDAGYKAITEEGPWQCIIFDHDLGLDDTKNGYKLMCVLEEHPEFIPENIMIITQNASAKPKMEALKRRLLLIRNKK